MFTPILLKVEEVFKTFSYGVQAKACNKGHIIAFFIVLLKEETDASKAAYDATVGICRVTV